MSESTTLSASPVIVENVTKRFRQGNTIVDALQDVRLTIEPGEFVAVMGASGSGKSTLLHVMAGLTRPDAGRVLVDGQDLAAMPDRAHGVSPPPHRTGLPGVQSDPDAHGPGQHPLAPVGRRAGRARDNRLRDLSRGSS